MCYDKEKTELNSHGLAAYRTDDPSRQAQLRLELDELFGGMQKDYHVSGFAHPKNLVFTNDKPFDPQFFYWGLVPNWIKDTKSAKEIANKTINARGETIFEKPAFRGPAKSKRCLVYVQSFFEHHHFNGNTYPFRIFMKDNSPMVLAGLWDEWVNKETGEVTNTYTIVTTVGNSVMAKIHNNPKAEMGPRMPVILPRDKQDEWLQPVKTEEDKKHIQSLIQPFDELLLSFYSVGKLKGKNAVGNNPQALREVIYPELSGIL